MNTNINEAIQCTVNQCEYHCNTKDYCTLNSIKVSTHEANPTEPKCTDCMSFKAKN